MGPRMDPPTQATARQAANGHEQTRKQKTGTNRRWTQIYADGGLGMVSVVSRSSSRTELVMVKLSEKDSLPGGDGLN